MFTVIIKAFTMIILVFTIRQNMHLVERVAYTWFNRLAALRYMDAKGWHPFRTRVLTAATTEETQPELLKLMRSGTLPEELRRHTDPAKLDGWLDGRIPSPDPHGEVYRQLVLAACRFYHALLPNLFERVDDETELLLPDDLLTKHSVAQGFRDEISDEDCDEVELLGWLYQFYISEKKDAVMARKSAVPSEDIPAVTQLFTPHWIVRYLVENSLGRLWLLNRPGSRLREKMPYYIEGEAEADFLKINRPEEIRLLDPAVGSGHMLTYAFDLLYAIYEEEGYAPSDIPALILTHNLHGLDICPRAAQLASLALVLKAREKSRRFFQPGNFVQPRILALQDVRFDESELSEYIRALKLHELFNQPVMRLMRQFENATTFGSLIQPCLGEAEIVSLRYAIEEKGRGSQPFLYGTHGRVLRVLEQAETLTQRYQVVVANPPYMGNGQMNSELKNMVKTNYTSAKQDILTCFMQRSFSLSFPGGWISMINLPSWMFLTSFEAFRKEMIQQRSILNLLQLGRGIFGSDFGTVAFTLKNSRPNGCAGTYRRLFERHVEVDSVEEKQYKFLDSTYGYYKATQTHFEKIPGAPIAYWVSDNMRKCFQEGTILGKIAAARQGMRTGDNARFLRLWWETPFDNLGLHYNKEKAASSGLKWFPYNKGGAYRKWYGNHELVVDWQSDGAEIKKLTRETYPDLGDNLSWKITNESYYFRNGITWGGLTSAEVSFRYSDAGALFDSNKGAMVFPDDTISSALLGFLNSVIALNCLKVLNPTLSTQNRDIDNLPFDIQRLSSSLPAITQCVQTSIDIAKHDWNNFETSWDFHDLPLLRPELKAETLVVSWQNWKAHCDAAIRRMQELETENNRLFIEAYGLQNELSPEVPEDQITLTRSDARKDVATFLSYAVGCMMGRYSLDKPGLILADAGDTLANYVAKFDKPIEKLHFAPDEDGVIPVLDGEWFEDDVVERVRELLRATFGKAMLGENLRFIEEALGKDLRKYFLTD
ncbi:MAG TPA: BREX-1 system adenine-specific DNA-methyltransferase PglX, partial [Candidatus Angelobacter sp.]|nr:BREX-1 system adenine-specific DNA-methyltransferase PglX [Candidatus Angelobacter sp.]